MSDYNGWTNRATWLANMWLEGYINATQEDGLRIMPDDLEAYVDTLFDQQCDMVFGLFRDMLSHEIASIDFQEIADAANESNVWDD